MKRNLRHFLLGVTTMTVFKGTGFYHVGAANTNRIVDVQVAVTAGGINDVFLFLKGNNAFHPWIGAISAPTTNEKIAQYRVDYIVRYLSIYAIPVGVRIVDVDNGGAETGNGIVISYETYVSNVFPSVADITDAYGMADRTPKVKDGLQTLADNCTFNASLDGGGTKLFAVNPALSDGTASTAVAIGTAASSLTVTLLTPSMY
jgi:hypothetical protein